MPQFYIKYFTITSKIKLPSKEDFITMGQNFSRMIRRLLSNNHAEGNNEKSNLKINLESDRLDLRNLGLKIVPEEIFQVDHFTWIQLSQNHLQSLPPEMGKFIHLKMLR